jgi:hypothetical protein
MTNTSTSTARRTFYLRHVVHVAVAGAEHSLCGVRLIGAIDTTADATCARCAAHRFETTPGIWAQVSPIGDGELGEIGGLPESTAGFAFEILGNDVDQTPVLAELTTEQLDARTEEIRSDLRDLVYGTPAWDTAKASLDLVETERQDRWAAVEDARWSPELVAPSGNYGFRTEESHWTPGAIVVRVVQLIGERRGVRAHWSATPAHYRATDVDSFPDGTELAIDHGAGWVLTAEDTAALAAFARDYTTQETQR